MVETATFFQGPLTASMRRSLSILFLRCPLCALPPLFRQCLSVKGEGKVKMRSQGAYFWPSTVQGGEQRRVRAQSALPY